VRVTVCEIPDERDAFEAAWRGLVAHATAERPALVLLPELPFHPWFGATPVFDAAIWSAVEEAHRRGLERLGALGAAVLSTAAVTRGGRRLNEGFVWDGRAGYRAAHQKHHLPDEDPVWEAHWYSRGDGRFELVEAAGARVGFIICSELWALDRARAYGKAGAQLLVTPRLTGRGSVDKWLAGGRAAAVYAGAYSLSSNRVSDAADFGGQGWAIDPDGAVLAVTTRERPFATVEIDLARADAAKATYPRYTYE